MTGDGFDVLYTIILLAHFREPAAHEPLLRIARLPESILDVIIGDFLTEDLGNALFATCDSQTIGLRALVLDTHANRYSREQAANALVLAVGQGYIGRDEVLSFFAGILTAERPDEDEIEGEIADAMLDLHPVEHEAALRWAWEQDRIDPVIMDWEYIERTLTEGPHAGALAYARERAQRDDIHDWMSWWHCFDKPRTTAPGALFVPLASYPAPGRTKDKELRKARKQERKARKEQRKKRKKR